MSLAWAQAETWSFFLFFSDIVAEGARIKSDLERLTISDGDILEITGLASITNTGYNGFVTKACVLTEIAAIAALAAYPPESAAARLAFFISSPLVMYFFLLKVYPADSYKKRAIKKMAKDRSNAIKTLMGELDRYNAAVEEIINQIDALDQLSEIGHKVGVKNRIQIILTVKNWRETIVRSLKTERVFRERGLDIPNSQIVDIQDGLKEFLPFQAQAMDGQAMDFEAFVNTSNTVTLRVQEEMRKLEEEYNIEQFDLDGDQGQIPGSEPERNQ